MNRQLKAKIIEQFGSQADFAQKIRVDESVISRVIRGRRVLSAEDQAKWCKALRCAPSILEPVSK